MTTEQGDDRTYYECSFCGLISDEIIVSGPDFRCQNCYSSDVNEYEGDYDEIPNSESQ
jgi:hypothetical protein